MLTVHVLGAVEVRRDGQPAELGGPQQRAVIAHLAMDAGRIVSVERLIDRLWGDEPPRTPLGTLQSYVSRLRRVLEPTRGTGAVPEVLVSEAPGYVLRLPPEQIDVHQFRALVATARATVATGDHARALELFDEALALWRGPALAGVGPEDQVRSIVVRLDEEHEAAIEDRFETLLTLGRHAEAIPLLQTAVDEQPLREQLWALLALALYRSSRQADALRALSTARTMLLDELGLDPGPELRDLENRILAQDPALALALPEHTTAAAPAPERDVAPRVELVERSDEWRALVEALEGAAHGGPHLVLIEGEPGIGKSTLCDAFLAHAMLMGWHSAVGRCVEPGLAPSLWPCIEVVREMIGERETDARDTEAPANPLRRLTTGRRDLGVSLSPVEMAEQFVALIDEMGNERWVILLDDLHWGDQATLDVMRLVLERLGSRPVLVIGAHRPPEIVPDSLLGDALGGLHRSTIATTRVSMSPLDTVGVARLMEITTGVTPSAELADRVQARAGGNPLFVTELARLAGERGLSDDSVVPEAIRDVVRERLAALPERATAELEVAAVLGERFDLRTAMAASERDPDSCLDALDAAIVTRILVPENGGFRFSHALVRDAVLAEISVLRLARLHNRVADAILAVHGDGADQAEPVAYHRLAAAAFTDPIVVATAAVRAADVARWRSALEAADRLADQALAVLAGVPRTPQVSAIEVDALEAIVSAEYRRTGDTYTERVAARVHEVADRTGSDAARALSLFLIWGPIDETTDLTTIADVVEQARQLASRTTDSYAIVTTEYMVGSYALLSGRIDEADEHLKRAIVASGAPHPDDRPEHVPLVLLPVIAGMVAAMRGETELAIEHTHRRVVAWLARRIEAADPTANLAMAFNRALIRALLGEPQAVFDELHGQERTNEAGFIREELATCEVLMGWARTKLGDAGGLDQAMDGMARFDAGPARVLASCVRSFLADAYMELGDARAVELLQWARAEAESRRELWWLSETLRLQAEADLRFGDGSRAVELLDEAEELANDQGARLILPRIAETRKAAPPAPARTARS